MRTIVVKDEQNLAGLRARVLSQSASGEQGRAAEAAIRAANPHLDLDRLPPGAVVVLPDHPGIAAGAGTRPGGPAGAAVGAGRTIADAHATVAASRDALARAAAAAKDRHDAIRRALTAPDVAHAAAADPALRERVTRATEAIEAVQRRTDQWRRDLADAMDGWEVQLDALTKRG